MSFEDKQVNFEEADRRYDDLERQRKAGTIDDRQFDAQRRRLMVQDDEGKWWIRSRETGDWHYHDGDSWVRATPPGYEEKATSPQVPLATGGGTPPRRRRRWPWVLAALVLLLVGLLGLGLIVWSFLPGGLIPDLGRQEGGGGGEAGGGGAYDAVLVHRATPDNISANSTYIDSPSTNDNPEAIVYVTQNWNPRGEGGTYNDHSVGVWYDGDRGRWAIFNQDREAMTENAAFNVFILEGPPE